jgi:hypothetical protein
VAAPLFRNASAASNAGGSLAVAKPAGLATGDLMVAWQYADNDGSLAAMGGPAGWSLLGSNAGVTGGHPYVKVWTRVATSSDVAATSFTFTNSGAGIHNSVAILAVVGGSYDTTTPTSAVAFQSSATASTSHVAPSVTGVVDGLLVTSHGSDTGGTGATYTPPAGMTERADTNPGTGGYTALEVCTVTLSSVAATGAKTATCTVNRPWKGSALVINPAAAAPPSGSRVNLAPNPACKTDATGWSAVSNTGAAVAGWGRSTSVDPALPRPTGFEGTTVPVDVLTPRAPVSAGQQYYWAISVKAQAALSGNLLVNYYTALSGGTFVANSGATSPLALGAGETGRFVIGPYTVPAGAVAGYLKLNDLDAACEITAYQVESAATYGDYFDDDSAGSSGGTFRQLAEPVRIADTFDRAVTAVGPVTSEPVAVAEAWSIAASGSLRETLQVRDSFLISSLQWDPVRGRNRVSAFVFTPNVVRARVTRRPANGGAWEAVRGGLVDVVAGRMTRTVDDYEFPSGVDLEYRIEGLTGAAGGQLVVQSATVSRRSTADNVWLKFITAPALNRRVDFMGRTDITRDARTAVYQVQGRSDPVVVSDVHSSRSFSIRVKTETRDETDALDHALSQGLPCYVQVPATINCPSIYAVVGSYTFEPPALKSPRNVWTIPLTEVSPPPASIVPPNATWQQLLDLYPTWEALMAAVPTWLQTAD